MSVAALRGPGRSWEINEKPKDKHSKCSSALMERQEWVDKAADRRSSGLSHSLGSLSCYKRCDTHLAVNSRICRHFLNRTACFAPGHFAEYLYHSLAFILLFSALPSLLSNLRRWPILSQVS